ncbi:MAG: hypothetical protein M1823_001263 [Watsoniomyces obsoletus]|nr:MAG: hypothetical protein M1823_001263 [Watsoniomyces obsoletus]
MITPAPIAGRQYYKIGDNVTFAWNYTSLSVTPSAIDILASCSLNQATYTIASNQSVQSAQSLVWDTRKEKTGSAPLPMATYTLLVYDAAQGPSATPSSGYLSSSNNFQFYMYNPREYEPLDQFKSLIEPLVSPQVASHDFKNADKEWTDFQREILSESSDRVEKPELWFIELDLQWRMRKTKGKLAPRCNIRTARRWWQELQPLHPEKHDIRFSKSEINSITQYSRSQLPRLEDVWYHFP